MCDRPTEQPEAEELLDVIRQLLGFSRAHSLEAEPGESAAYSRAKRLLDDEWLAEGGRYE